MTTERPTFPVCFTAGELRVMRRALLDSTDNMMEGEMAYEKIADACAMHGIALEDPDTFTDGPHFIPEDFAS